MLFSTSRTANAANDVQKLDLQKLIAELSKSKPDVNMVKKKTDSLGIPYNPDLIILMSEVLVYLSKSPRPNKTHKEQLKEN